MLSFFKRKSPGVITVTLNAKLAPEHRAELEDAFVGYCEKNDIAAEVVGGGTLLAANGEVDECDIEVKIDDVKDALVQRVADVFAAMLAPKGSRITVPGRAARLEFGDHEGLGLYLNGTDLPDEIYASCDSNHVYDECERLLKGVAMVNSHWRGPTETALYMYGRSFEEMQRLLKPLLDDYPLCQRARVVRIA